MKNKKIFLVIIISLLLTSCLSTKKNSLEENNHPKYNEFSYELVEKINSDGYGKVTITNNSNFPVKYVKYNLKDKDGNENIISTSNSLLPGEISSKSTIYFDKGSHDVNEYAILWFETTYLDDNKDSHTIRYDYKLDVYTEFANAKNSIDEIVVANSNSMDKKSENIINNNVENFESDSYDEIIKVGAKHKSELLEMSINGYEWTQLIEPVKKSTYYSYYKNENPNDSKYIKLKGTFKNLSGNTVDINDYSLRISINNKYTYLLQAIYEIDGDLENLVYIKPLEEREIILFTSIPNEAINSIESIFLQFGYNDDDNNMFDPFDSKEHKILFELNKLEEVKNSSKIIESDINTNKNSAVKTSNEDKSISLIGSVQIVRSEYANVRFGPGFAYEIAGTLDNGTEVYIFDTKYNDNRLWCKISGEDDLWLSIKTLNGEVK